MTERSKPPETLAGAVEFLLSVQREDGHWCAELQSNPTITAEYVFLRQILELDLSPKRVEIVRFFKKEQNVDGSWSIAHGWDGDVSTTAETYLALRILGLRREDPVLKSARAFLLRNGGLEQARVFTRIFLAMFGLYPWDQIPVVPPELILLPKRSPLNIEAFSSWARSTMVPLFVILHHRPAFRLPCPVEKQPTWLDELWLKPERKQSARGASVLQLVRKHGLDWKPFFAAADSALRSVGKLKFRPFRDMALQRCTEWVLSRQEPTGDWAGIFPPMFNGIVALKLQGHGLDSPPIQAGLRAVEDFAWEDHEGFRIQPCVSPVWDTTLSSIALIDSGVDPSHPSILRAVDWLQKRQCESGAWSFEYSNTWYPDVDDTAAVVLTLLRLDCGAELMSAIERAIGWILTMQNRDGGWAAFDVDNDRSFLNEIPFSDMDSLCDPSSPDVTGRVLEAIGRFERKAGPDVNSTKLKAATARALQYLRESQERQGSWYGRWGVNYIYGTSNVLCGLAQVGIVRGDEMVEHALRWLKHVQKPDGGWGESIASYADKRWMGRGDSTPSQTGWALMGLLSYLPASDPSVEKGVSWLLARQVEAMPTSAQHGKYAVPAARGATWEEAAFTGTGFPNHFYLRYHYYRHYFPLMALGRYLHVASA